MKVVGFCGTHHQAFQRLVTAFDELAATGIEAWVQYGTAAAPRKSDGKPNVDRDEVAARMREADVVVTHGGPGLIWEALEVQRPVVVVPREARYREHVDDHQVAFARHLEKRGWVTVVRDVMRLGAAVHAAAELGGVTQVRSVAAETVDRIGNELDALTRSDAP